MAKKKTNKVLTVVQTRSAIRRPRDQVAALASLGLGKLWRPKTLVDTPDNRGRIAKVAHLVSIVDES